MTYPPTTRAAPSAPHPIRWAALLPAVCLAACAVTGPTADATGATAGPAVNTAAAAAVAAPAPAIVAATSAATSATTAAATAASTPAAMPADLAPAPPPTAQPQLLETAAAPTAAGALASEAVKIRFIDLDSFDKALEQALVGGAQQIEITMVTPMSPNAIAPRLGRWLNTVQENGGELTVNSETRTRSLSIVASLLDAAIGAWRDYRTRSLMKDMNAELLLRSNEIQTVTLKRKTAS